MASITNSHIVVEEQPAWVRDWRDKADIVLGSGHWLRWSYWRPDLHLDGNKHWAALFTDEALAANGHTHASDGELLYVVGASILHLRPSGVLCEGGVMFERPELGTPFDKGDYWQVESWEPLTLSPSILCGMERIDGTCGDHGYVRENRWVAA